MKPSSRKLLLKSGLALFLTLLLGAGALCHALLFAPPVPCPLPRLEVPRPGTLAWSPDSKRLLVGNLRGEVSVVHVPDGRVETLPSMSDPAIALGWDRAGRPLVFSRNAGDHGVGTLARLDAAGRWETLLHGQQFAISPDGDYVAWVPPLPLADQAVEITYLRTLRRERRLRIAGKDRLELRWNRTVPLLRTTNRPVTSVPDASALARSAGPEPAPLVHYDAHTGLMSKGPAPWPSPVPVTEILIRETPRLRFYSWAKVHQSELLRLAPPLDGINHDLWIAAGKHRPEQRVPLGRVIFGRQVDWSRTWGRITPSPDGRYIALIAPDYSLRLLDLQEGSR